MKMFMFSLKDDARDWYFSLPTASISTLREFHDSFSFQCKSYYSYEFLFHDCCQDCEKSVQATLSFSLDCEVEEYPSLSFPSSRDLKAYFICCSYQEETVDDFVLEADIFDNLASDEVTVSNIEQEHLVVDKHFDDEHFVDREHIETKHYECLDSKVFYGQPIFDEYTSDGDEQFFSMISLEPLSTIPIYDDYESDPWEFYGGV